MTLVNRYLYYLVQEVYIRTLAHISSWIKVST
jgi:hypothetical protein